MMCYRFLKGKRTALGEFQLRGLMGCRFVNDMLQIRESEKDSFGGHPVERSHGEIIIISLPDSKLFLEIREAEEFMTSIELFVIFSVTAFNLSVMPWRIRPNQLVPDTKLF